MRKLLLITALSLLAACSDTVPNGQQSNEEIEAFLKTFDCKTLDTHKFDNDELKRRARVYCTMKTEHTPSKPERHTFG